MFADGDNGVVGGAPAGRWRGPRAVARALLALALAGVVAAGCAPGGAERSTALLRLQSDRPQVGAPTTPAEAALAARYARLRPAETAVVADLAIQPDGPLVAPPAPSVEALTLAAHAFDRATAPDMDAVLTQVAVDVSQADDALLLDLQTTPFGVAASDQDAARLRADVRRCIVVEDIASDVFGPG